MDNQLIILGGMGPQASIKLHELLIAGSQKFHDGAPESYPAILHVSVPVPDFVESKQKYQDALALIQRVCSELPLENASAIGMACNTAHLMEADLPLSTTPFVSMIRAVVDQIEAARIKSVGLMASPQTIRTLLYHEALQAQGISVITPLKSEVAQLNRIIHAIIHGEEPANLRPELSMIADSLAARGAEAIVLGCTELPLIGVDTDLPAIDSLQSLADAMLHKHYTEKAV